MSRFVHHWFDQHLLDHAEEGRDVQLFQVHGQIVFPMFSPVTGGLYSHAAVFPILRGEGDRAPAYGGSFPTEDGATIELGNGWIVMCVLFSSEMTAPEKIGKLQAAEEKLRAMKSGNSGTGGNTCRH